MLRYASAFFVLALAACVGVAGAAADAGGDDAGPPDGGGADAGPSDAGAPDAGGRDAGGADAGAMDAGPTDSGDAAVVDAGGPDAGAPDGGRALQCTTTLFPGDAIDTAFNALPADGVVCLHSGKYGGPTSSIFLDRSGTAGHPLTLTTAPGEAPATIEGGFQVGVNDGTGHRSHIVVSHLNFALDYGINGESQRVNGTSAGCTANSVFGIQLNGGDLVFEYNDVSEASVSPELRDTALGANFEPGLVEPDIVIRYNKIHDFGACDHFDHGMYLDFISSGEISGNWIWNGGCSYGNGGGDHSLGCGAGIQLWVMPSGLTVHSNVIDGTGVGFYLAGSSNALTHNVVMNTRGSYNLSGALEPMAQYSGYGADATDTYSDNDGFNAGPLCSDCTATSINNLGTDPLFTDPAHHDYTLLPGSPVSAWGPWDGTGR